MQTSEGAPLRRRGSLQGRGFGLGGVAGVCSGAVMAGGAGCPHFVLCSSINHFTGHCVCTLCPDVSPKRRRHRSIAAETVSTSQIPGKHRGDLLGAVPRERVTSGASSGVQGSQGFAEGIINRP